MHRIGGCHRGKTWNIVVIEHMVGSTVIESQTIRLQAKPETVAIVGKDCLYAIHRQLKTRQIQMVKTEGRRSGTEMDDTIVASEHPEISDAIRQHIIAERQDGIVHHDCDIIEIHTGKTFYTTSPDGMAHGILHQPMERAEVASPVVYLVNAGVILILRMVQSDDTILPSAYPQPSTTVHKQ